MSQSTLLVSNKDQNYHPLPDSEASSSKSKPCLNKYALAGAILASTNSILLGYDIGVMSGAALYIREDMNITSTQLEILIGSLNVCSLIGSIASGKTSDWIGRRYTIVLAAATFLVGAVLMVLDYWQMHFVKTLMKLFFCLQRIDMAASILFSGYLNVQLSCMLTETEISHE